MIRKNLIALLMIFCAGSLVCGEDHPSTASFVPGDVAVFGSIQDPAGLFQQVLESCGSDEDEIERILDLLLFTDPTDGTERKRSGDREMISFLSTIRSVHLVVMNSQKEIGDFALLFDRGDNSETISEETAKLMVQVASQIAKRRISPYITDALQKYLTVAQNNLRTGEADNWFVVGSSADCTNQILNSIQAGELPACLAKTRSFNSSSNSSLEDSNWELFVSFRNCKSLVMALGLSDEKSWQRKGFDEVPWQAFSGRIDSTAEGVYFDWKKTISTTLPKSGEAKLWEYYSEIDSFPPVPEEAVMVRAKSVELAQWHAQSKLDYQKTYGETAYESYESNPVVAFHTGISRPKLGGVQFDYWDGSYKPGQLVLYKINDDAAAPEIHKYLETYYKEVEKQSKNDLNLDYRQTTVRGLEAWWSDEFEDKEQRSLSIDRFALASERSNSIPSRNESEASTEDQDTDQETVEQIKKDESNWLPGDGAVIFENWVAMGSGEKVDSVADWDQGFLIDDGTAEELENRLLSAHARFGTSKKPHVFEYKKGRAIQEDLVELTEYIHMAMPLGWSMRESDFQNMKDDLGLVREYSRPVQLRFHLRKLMENFCDRAESWNTESFSVDMSKKIVGQSMFIENQDAEK